MLNKEFLKYVAVAFVITTPIAYYVSNNWLNNFAYRTTLDWWVFVLPGIFCFGTALLIISWKSYREASRNPVEAIQNE